MLAVTKASAIVVLPPGVAKRRWIAAPSSLSLRSIPTSEPAIPPTRIAPSS